MSETSAEPGGSPPAIDTRALRQVLRRLALADAPPWLHQEVARRMAERLPVIRQPPARWIDWWAHTGGGALAVQGVWPQAQRLVVEPTPELLARSRQPQEPSWWSRLARRYSAACVLKAVKPRLAFMQCDRVANVIITVVITYLAADLAINDRLEILCK